MGNREWGMGAIASPYSLLPQSSIPQNKIDYPQPPKRVSQSSNSLDPSNEKCNILDAKLRLGVDRFQRLSIRYS
jgi:hypothetical protein